jgi:hypothetical protein
VGAFVFDGGGRVSLQGESAVSPLVRVFISYAHDDDEHRERVRRFWIFLRSQGIDARCDLDAVEQRQDWPLWMLGQIRAARFVLMIASPQYRRRADGEARSDEGRGVQWEARLAREVIYADQQNESKRFLPVVLPGCSERDIPQWMGPTSFSNYFVSDYTLQGAESLLRLLTGQPGELAPPIGPPPLLPPQGAGVDGLVRHLAERSRRRYESTVQSYVRQLLLNGELGLDEFDLGVAIDRQDEDRRRIDIAAACVVVEVRADLRVDGVANAAERELGAYLSEHSSAAGVPYVGILTDGAEWRLLHPAEGRARQVACHTIAPSAPDVEGLLRWLESVLATRKKIRPTREEIEGKLGADSPAHAVDAAELTAIYDKYRDLPSVRMKRGLWARLLTTAMGTNFSDEDDLFLNHTLLVTMAKVIGHAVMGFRPEEQRVAAADIMSGKLFSESQIDGVIEADFFDWMADAPEGERFVKGLARRLTRFAWGHVDFDVMKVLYESIISSTTRHRLGEYYTPDWLAEEIIAACVADPLDQRVLDPSCGSGTFLFHAVRHYLSAAEAADVPSACAISGLMSHVIGIDVQPVAVTLARVTYLLAIGRSRLQATDRPALSVPVYLSDSLRWGQESTLFSAGGLSIPTSGRRDMYVVQPEAAGEVADEDDLTFPERVLQDAQIFDQLINLLAEWATKPGRGSAPRPLDGVFQRLGIHPDDRPVVERTFATMCRLHDEGRDHIWGYYVRNLARPVWLTRQDNRIDVLVGNPPWLAYRYMTKTQQVSFRAMSKARNIWAGGPLTTNVDLSALFVARCVELYLRPGGRFGYVMPLATLSRQQYEGFRSGHYDVPSEHCAVSFDRPWDLARIKPTFFPVPACVVFGRRENFDGSPKPLAEPPEVWSGKFSTATASRAEAAANITRLVAEEGVPRGKSLYADRFSQGATVVPRLLFVVEPENPGPLGSGAGRQMVHSRRSTRENKGWRDVPSLRGAVERQFIKSLYLGESILPFRCLEPRQAVIPWDGRQLLHGSIAELDRYPGLSDWWRQAETVWEQHRSSDRLSLVEQLDYRRKLVRQLGAAHHRVVYSASGMYMAAVVVSDPVAVIEHKLYWGPAENLDEARFLTAVLNSDFLTAAVRPLQGRGEHNPRDFDKYVFRLPIPLYNGDIAAHRTLVSLAERAEHVAAGVELPPVRFEAQRRLIRKALAQDGVAAEINAVVAVLLA